PAAEELRQTADRLRRLLWEQEHRKKLGRRLETIREKIALHAWPQALSLMEAMELEFPGEPDLDPLREQIRAGLKRWECEAIASEVRRCLADGDAEQAELVLKSSPWSGEPSLQALWEELEA